jgi:hypothetical protein
MNTRTRRAAVALSAVAICAGGTVLASPAQAQRIDNTGAGYHQFDDIGYVVAYRKAQMAHDYVAHAADRVLPATAASRH